MCEVLQKDADRQLYVKEAELRIAIMERIRELMGQRLITLQILCEEENAEEMKRLMQNQMTDSTLCGIKAYMERRSIPIIQHDVSVK